MPRIIGSEHPDLWGGKTPIVRVRPLDAFDREELAQLPRDAFTDAEWEQLDDDLKEAIYENDPESKARVERLVKEFVDRHQWSEDPGESWLQNSLRSSTKRLLTRRRATTGMS